MRAWVAALAVAIGAASAAATARGGPPQKGILQPVGGGVRLEYVVGADPVRCSLGLSGRTPQVACAVGGKAGRRGFGATMDRRRLVFSRARAGRSTVLSTVSQRAGPPIYGAFRRYPPRLIRLADDASVGFLGTNVACTAAAEGPAPGMLCLAHAGQGLPGPCCGPDYPLLVGSHGFLISPSELEELLVVNDGVSVGSSGPPPGAPFRVVRVWRP
jgi:hypothetical protein